MPNVSLNSPTTSPASVSRARMASPPASPPLVRTRSPSMPGIPALTLRLPSSGTTATTSTGSGSTAATATTNPYSPQSTSTSPGFPTPLSSVSPGVSISGGAWSVSPTSPPARQGLLVPTDRGLDDLEDNWLPKLGRLTVDREVRVPGYSLYGIRSWYLSRRHWAFTIATSTSKPSDTISCYVIVPLPELSEAAGQVELAKAERRLAHELNGVARKTQYGTLLVSLPAAYRQELPDLRGRSISYDVSKLPSHIVSHWGANGPSYEVGPTPLSPHWVSSTHGLTPPPSPSLAPSFPALSAVSTRKRRLSPTHTDKLSFSSPIQMGDMREAWPFIVLNTALRRLGCGGRAAMGNEFPVPAVRRKFYELYRIAAPKGGPENDGLGAGPHSPPASPTTHNSHGFLHSSASSATTNSSQPTAETVANSPLLLNVVELVKLLQGALALWGMYGTDTEEFEMDGLFCDETKAGLFEWRRVMGMESDDGFKLAKETSGGCIDPRTLAALLSSITSVRYQLAVLGVEKLPKDPFGSPRKFLNAWRVHQSAMTLAGKNTATSPYLSVGGIRSLNTCYIAGRSKTHATDALKVHRILLSGVASATSNLRGNQPDDSSTPLRKREQHKKFRGDEDDVSGIGLIVPDGNGNAVSAPDVITTDLEAYRKLIEKAREKEWDVMGARRVAELWSGATAEKGPERDGARHHGRLQAFRRRVTKDNANDTDDDTNASSAIGAFKGMRDRTGAALKGGFGLVGRRHGTAAYDTSDSEGPSKSRRKQQSVPLVIEPNGDEQANSTMYSRSPSPSTQFREMPLPLTPNLRSQHSNYPPITSPLQQSIRLSSPNLAGDVSDVSIGQRSGNASPNDRRRSLALSANSNTYSFNDRSMRVGPGAIPASQPPKMLRTRSGPAEVLLDPRLGALGPAPIPHLSGATATPIGLGLGLYPGQKFSAADFDDLDPKKLKRNKSFTHSGEYRGVRRKAPRHLAIDVAMCDAVWQLRRKERELAQRAADMQTLERSALTASQAIFDARDLRLSQVSALEAEAAELVAELEDAAHTGVEDDQELLRSSRNIQFFLSEDMNTNEVVWGLHDLQKAWEGMGEDTSRANEVRSGDAADAEGDKGDGNGNGKEAGTEGGKARNPWWGWLLL